MTVTWNDRVPIYRQLQQRVVAMILDGALNEGDALQSVRQVAAEFQINPLTVSKAYQELVDQQLVEKRRGLGMFVVEGARAALLVSERERFLREEWPMLFARLQRLGLDLKTLLREGSTEATSTHKEAQS
ncbi:MAG: GntR family transcriptional regulator [Rhodanobacter sp.]